MNVFVGLFLAFALSLLALLFFLILMIAIDSRKARMRRTAPGRHTTLSFHRAALGKWRVREHILEKVPWHR